MSKERLSYQREHQRCSRSGNINELRDSDLVDIIAYFQEARKKVCNKLSRYGLGLENIDSLISEAKARGLLLFDACNIDDSMLKKRITGALKMSIVAHGPVTAENIESAVKRILGVTRNEN